MRPLLVNVENGLKNKWRRQQSCVWCTGSLLRYAKFVTMRRFLILICQQVWRQKEAAMQNSQLTKILLANSAHEVRTPLNAIINYLEIALEGALDQETRDNIAKSHSASKSLIYVINDLLDLTKTEEGNDLIKDEVFDLPATIREASDSFKGDVQRKGLNLEILQQPGFPQYVYGDQRRIRQIITNIVANSVQHTSNGWIRVEMWLQEYADCRATVEIVVHDSGAGMSNSKLDELFRDLEQVSDDQDLGLDGSVPSDQAVIEGKDGRALGLGLAMVARIIRNADGQLRLKSEEGKGSRFVVQLPFNLPPDDDKSIEDSNRPSLIKQESSTSHASLLSTSPPAVAVGEVTLVDKGSLRSQTSQTVVSKRSTEDISSLHSFKSGSSTKTNKSNKSDVDRLIDAISGPLSVGEPESEERSLQRSNSKGSVTSRRSAGHIQSARSSVSRDRPGGMVRSKSFGTPEHLRSPIEGLAGSEFVTDMKTPMKAVKMPDDLSEVADPPSHIATKVLFDLPHQVESSAQSHKQYDASRLRTLVAEDDPVNSKIIKKRLEKSGHEIYHTINGEECASAYGEKPAFFDVVLMDMQVRNLLGLFEGVRYCTPKLCVSTSS